MTITPTQAIQASVIMRKQWLARTDMVREFALKTVAIADKPKEYFEMEDFFCPREEMEIDGNGIAEINITGMLLDECPKIYEKLGMATGYETIMDEIEDALEDGAKAILFCTNSPGGTVSGNLEVAQYIAQLPVPTAAHCVGMACSAAYKLISGTGFITANPSADVGNIGTILCWADDTEFWKMMGVEFKAIVNQGADLKSTFHLMPDSTQMLFLQEQINAAGQIFHDHVLQGRTKAGATLDPEIWRAGWYSGAKAEDLGLIDGLGSENDCKMELMSRI